MLFFLWATSAIIVIGAIRSPSADCGVDACAMAVSGAAMLFVLAFVPYIVSVASAIVADWVVIRWRDNSKTDTFE